MRMCSFPSPPYPPPPPPRNAVPRTGDVLIVCLAPRSFAEEVPDAYTVMLSREYEFGKHSHFLPPHLPAAGTAREGGTFALGFAGADLVGLMSRSAGVALKIPSAQRRRV